MAKSDKVYWNAKLPTWHFMSYYVAEKLHLRPLEILQTWNRPELLVAYGFYLNEESQKQYMKYLSLPESSKQEYKKDNQGKEPEEYALKFFTFGDLEMYQEKALTKEEIDVFNAATGKG